MKTHHSILTLVFTLISSWTGAISIQDKPSSTTTNLRSIDFENSKEVKLDQSWEFYWNQLYTPEDFATSSPTTFHLVIPENWAKMSIDGDDLGSFGYATYRTRFILDTSEPLLAIHIPGIFSSCRIWVDGYLLKEMGKVGTSEETTVHRRKSVTLPFAVRSDTVEIIIQAANFYHQKGGITKVPSIGNSEQLLRIEKRKAISGMLYIGSLGFIGTSFLLLYLFLWRKDKAILYFALFCLCWSYRELSYDYAPLVVVFKSLPWSIHVRFEYLSLYLGAMMGSLFLGKIFSYSVNSYYKPLIINGVGFFMITAILLPSYIYTSFLPIFFGTMVINLIYITVVIFKGALDGRRESRLALSSLLLAIAVLSFHAFFYVDNDSYNMIYIYIGYIGVFLLSSMILGTRFSRSFFKLESLQMSTMEQKEEISTQAEQMMELNSILTQRSAELKQKNNEIVDINKSLEKKVQKRTARLEALNEELDTFLYKSSHDMRRPIKSLLGLVYLGNKTIKDKEARLLFERVKKSAESMDSLLSKLAEIIEIKDHEFITENVDMKAMMQKVKYDVKGLVVNVDKIRFESKYPDKVRQDPTLLYKLLFEIFRNSAAWVDHSKENLTLKTKIVQNDKRTKIVIKDNGPGIPKEVIGEVFAMYKVGNEQVNGHGLGLYMVDKILQKMNGKIRLESEIDSGTKVIITIPTN